MATVTIHLHGHLKKFGDSFTLEIDTPREAIAALMRQVEGFREALRQGAYKFIRGARHGGFLMDIGHTTCTIGKCQELHLVPVVKGSGRVGAIIGIVLGVALIAIGGWAILGPTGAIAAAGSAGTTLGAALGTTVIWGISAGAFIGAGIGLTLAGISGLLASKVAGDYDQNNDADKRESFLFSGAVNSSAQGVPVPLVFGQHLTGSVVVSTGLSSERI